MASRPEPKLLAKCHDAVREIVPGVDVILYGFRACGDTGLESDYGLLILIDGPVAWKVNS